LHGAQIEVQQTVKKNLNVSHAVFAPPSKWRPWHVPCLTFRRYATDRIIKHITIENVLEMQLTRNNTYFWVKIRNM